jgi:hypothetical protein
MTDWLCNESSAATSTSRVDALRLKQPYFFMFAKLEEREN